MTDNKNKRKIHLTEIMFYISVIYWLLFGLYSCGKSMFTDENIDLSTAQWLFTTILLNPVLWWLLNDVFGDGSD